MFLQTRNCWCLAIILLVCINLTSGLRINEVELNPQGEDSGNEWVELYSSEQIDLSNYFLKNYDNQTITLSGSFNGFFIANLQGQWLDNSNEKVLLLLNSSLIDETNLFSDSSNDNRTWQYCSSGWKLVASTRGLENSCQTQDITINQTSNNQDVSIPQIPSIDIILIFDNPLECTGEFEVGFKAFNLQDRSYDVKLWLEKDDNVISEIFDDNDEVWYSGNYYINKAFSGEGNKTQDIKMRLKKDYANFSGEAWIKARIKENNKDAILDYREETIEISQKIPTIIDATVQNLNTEQSTTSENLSSDVIILTKDIKSQKVWKSKLEYIKEYSIYGFTLFCILALIIIVIKYKSKKRFKK
ncbi:MAG: hypothetical protein NT076_00715 [Candidatus Pacearchaeota archaeon]|nr:hypothetical protein [Candidatus Pacearchaeota archaeon]